MLNEYTKLRDAKRMAEKGMPVHKNVIMPTYKMDERLKVYREENVPSESLYMGIGYDGAVTD